MEFLFSENTNIPEKVCDQRFGQFAVVSGTALQWKEKSECAFSEGRDMPAMQRSSRKTILCLNEKYDLQEAGLTSRMICTRALFACQCEGTHHSLTFNWQWIRCKLHGAIQRTLLPAAQHHLSPLQRLATPCSQKMLLVGSFSFASLPSFSFFFLRNM